MIFKICQWLFLLLIVSLPLIRPFDTDFFGLRVPFTDFIFLAVFGFWLAALVRRETSLKFSKLFWFIGFYALTLTISTVFSTEPRRSFIKLLGEFYLFALAVLTLNLVRERDFLKKMVFAWLAGTALTVLASLSGFALFYFGFKTQADNFFLSHFGSLPAGNYPRIHALFANANMMTNFLNVSLTLTLLAAKTGWLKRIWAVILQGGIWFAALFTFSPGLGGLLLSFGIWQWAVFKENKKPRLSKLSLAAAIIGGALVFGSTLISPDTNNTARDFSMPLTDKKFEPSVRVLVWENALQSFTEFPFTGRGTGTRAAQVQYQPLSGGTQILLDAHNAWLNVLGQTGLLGLTAFTLLIFYLIGKCRFNFEQLNSGAQLQLALSCAFIGAFLYQGLSGSFEDARHLWILIGMLAGVSTFWKNDTSEASLRRSDRPSI